MLAHQLVSMSMRQSTAMLAITTFVVCHVLPNST